MNFKSIVKRTLAAGLALGITAAGLVSCSSTQQVIYCEDNGKITESMNENMFSYHLSDNKTYYLYGLGATGDSASFWEMQATEDGKTVGDMAFESVIRKAKEIVASANMFEETKKSSDKAGSVLSEAELQIEKQVDTLVAQLTKAQGGKRQLEAFLSQFGTDLKNLRQYYTMYFKMSALQGSFVPTEEEKKAYFEDNYSIVKHILINTTFKVKDDGSRVSMSEEEKQVQLARAKALEARLSAGEDFDVLWALPEYQDADAAGAAKYPEGYFVCKNSDFTQEFEDAALDMEAGEIRTVSGTYGIHIMKKYPMDGEKYKLYSDVLANIESKASAELFDEALAPYMEKVKVNDEVLANYSMVTAPLMQ